MIKKILLALAVIVIVFLIVAAFQPADFRIERSITLSAPPAVAFAYANDLHKWQQMSPYAPLDPAAKYTFTGPSAGVGAALAWAGNMKVGEGRLVIAESRPGEFVKMNLEFLKPFECANTAEFTFKNEGNQTKVTWVMYGTNNFVSKAMGLVVNMDKMLGGQFEQGLANLKSLAEAEARK